MVNCMVLILTRVDRSILSIELIYDFWRLAGGPTRCVFLFII